MLSFFWTPVSAPLPWVRWVEWRSSLRTRGRVRLRGPVQMDEGPRRAAVQGESWETAECSECLSVYSALSLGLDGVVRWSDL